MKAKFTEGEWIIIEKGVQRIIAVNSAYIAMVMPNHVGGEEAEANAKLIAAAPKMLEALIEISKGQGRYDMDRLRHAANTIEDMKELAIEAIKEATE